MQEKIDFALIAEFKAAVSYHHTKPIHTIWQEHPSLRSLFMGKQVVVFNPRNGQDQLYKLSVTELFFYFQELLSISTPFSSQIVKAMWKENLELQQLFCGLPVPVVNPDTNQQAPFKIPFAEVLKNFKSASRKAPDIALTLLNNNECLHSWLKGEQVCFFNSTTRQSTMKQIDGEALLVYFKCVLRSRKQELINFMWTDNVFLFDTIKALSFEESLALLKKVMKSSSKGDGIFIKKYLQLITNYEVIFEALNEIESGQSQAHKSLATLLNARLAQLPMSGTHLSQEQMDLIRIRNFLSTYTLGPKNNIFIEAQYHNLLNKYRKIIGIVAITKVKGTDEELYKVTFDMTIFPYFLNNEAIPKRVPQQAPQTNFHETVALNEPGQQQNTMPHPLMSTHAGPRETNIPDRAINQPSSHFHHPMSGWQGVHHIHPGSMVHQMIPTHVSSTPVYPPVGDYSSTATTTSTSTSNASLLQEEAFLGQASIGAPEQQTVNINNGPLHPVTPDRSLSSGVSAYNSRQVTWNTTSSFTPFAQKRTMTSNESLPVTKKRKTTEHNVEGTVEESPALPQQPFIAEPNVWTSLALYGTDFQAEDSENDLELPSQAGTSFQPVITTHQQIKKTTTTSNDEQQETVLPMEASQQSQIHEESSSLKENYAQYYQGPPSVEGEVNLESLTEMDEFGWSNVCNSYQDDMLSSSMLNHIGFFGVPQSSQETKQTEEAEQKIKDTNSP